MMSTLIKRNSAIPVEGKKLYSTNADNQTSVEVSVYEGERPKVLEHAHGSSWAKGHLQAAGHYTPCAPARSRTTICWASLSWRAFRPRPLEFRASR